jgi:hypothetical protein
MLMFGDLLKIMALIGNLILLLCSIISSRELTLRGGGGGIIVLVITIVAFTQKLANPETADFEIGFIFGFSDGLVIGLLGLAAVLMVFGIGLSVFRLRN